ncbi:MAG: hypothetical protein JXR20_03500 [Balneola sp.]
MRQVQQLTQVLSRILEQVVKKEKSESATIIVSYTNEQLKESLGFDLDKFSDTLEEKGIEHFIEEKNFNNDHLNIFADILYELAEAYFKQDNSIDEGLRLYSQSLHIYEFIEENGSIYSIDRNLKITKIKDLIK